jgi:hypothetical protein
MKNMKKRVFDLAFAWLNFDVYRAAWTNEKAPLDK